MALITCPSCGHQISDKALHCPKCGCSPSVRANEDNTANSPSVNDTAVQNPSVQAEGTNNQTSKGIVSPSRPNGEKSAKDASTQDSHIQLRQKGDRASKKIATTIIIVAVVVAVCAAGAIYGIHRHNVKVLASQQAELQRQLEEEELARQKAIEDSIARVNFQTPDLKMVGAHGPVKRITYNSVVVNGYRETEVDPVLGAEFISFDEKGYINKMIGYGKDILVDRNSQNMIVELLPTGMDDVDDMDDMDDMDDCNPHITYGEDSFVKQIHSCGPEGDSYVKLIWNTSGTLSKKSSETYPYKQNIMYEYLKTDKYGNWIEVEETIEDWCGDYTKVKHTITRTIEYYE